MNYRYYYLFPEWLNKKQLIANHTAESAGAPDSIETKDPCWPPVYNENNAGEEGTQRETDKSLHFENQEEKRGQVQPMNWQAAPVGPNRASADKQSAPFELPRKRCDDFDLLSGFIMLRSKHLKPQSEETNNAVDAQDEGSLKALLQVSYYKACDFLCR